MEGEPVRQAADLQGLRGFALYRDSTAARQRGPVIGFTRGDGSKFDGGIVCMHSERTQIFGEGIIALPGRAPSEGICIVCRPPVRDGTGGSHRRSLPVHQSGNRGLCVCQRGSVISLCGGAGGDLHRCRRDRQRALLLLQNIVARIGAAPVDRIRVFTFSYICLPSRRGDFDGILDPDPCVMRLLTPERPVIIICDLRVDGDPHIGQILHQVVRLILSDGQAVLFHGLFTRLPLRELCNTLCQQYRIPAGIGTGLRRQFRVFRVQTKDLLRQFLYRDCFNQKFYALSAALLVM